MVRGLEAKGYVGHKAYGGTYQYYPLVSEEEFSRKTLKGVVSKYFDNSYLGVVSSGSYGRRKSPWTICAT